MISANFTRDLCVRDSKTKILMLVIDGLGGLPDPTTGLSELETARLPNLDALTAASSCGLIEPLGPGFTPGSGPAHLALFGYDPWGNEIGRGALSALGLGLDFASGDVAARLNFCTVDADMNVIDRRAGRIATEQCELLCRILQQIQIPGVKIAVAPEMEYRAGVVFKGTGLDDRVGDSDPQVTGVQPKKLEALNPAANKMVSIANNFLIQVRDLLKHEEPANMVLMRGFGRYPELPQMNDIYGLKGLGIAGYPMYRGVAGAVGMETVATGWDLPSELTALEERWEEYDFFYVHAKKTDSAGEDGDFSRKIELLEEIDYYVPQLTELAPEVFIVTGDHSTPAIMRQHSWHPVPLILQSSWGIADPVATFSERGCRQGDLGTLPSSALMALALAHAGRLTKFGA